MTEERDPKVSRRYRELGAEEPSHELDAAILAASRRTAKVRPAPLVPPTGRRRWYFPVAAAAVIMLSVAVTWHMQLERPDPEAYVGAKQERLMKAQEPAALPAPEPPRAAAPAEPAAPERQARMRAESSAEQATRDESARVGEMSGRRDAAQAAMAEIEPPEKWLERIAELRKAGKHVEADKELEAFRKRYPDYKVPGSALRPEGK